MRDLNKESVEHQQRVERANLKVLAQIKLVQGLAHDDPKMNEAKQVLRAMQQNAAVAEMNKALSQDDEAKAEEQPAVRSSDDLLEASIVSGG